MRYPTVGEILEAHELEVGPDAIVDIGLLESAILRPQTTIAGLDAYPDIHSKAAALLHSLIRNHPFIDGNKRTAVLSIALFYRLNGWRLFDEAGDLIPLAVDTAEGILDVETIGKRLASLARSDETPAS
jgi:death-on-curing protein